MMLRLSHSIGRVVVRLARLSSDSGLVGAAEGAPHRGADAPERSKKGARRAREGPGGSPDSSLSNFDFLPHTTMAMDDSTNYNSIQFSQTLNRVSDGKTF